MLYEVITVRLDGHVLDLLHQAILDLAAETLGPVDAVIFIVREHNVFHIDRSAEEFA